mmetsp:Transcript_119577/g.232796  ORF Transcript_119577/g.232796 Transcript_119577/m.232796 type:complete len:270 (-) Transcript_119577:246-1055(-)
MMVTEESPVEQRCGSCATWLTVLPLGAASAFVLAHVGIVFQSTARRAVLDALDSIGSGADLIALPTRLFVLPAVITSLTGFAALGIGCILSFDCLRCLGTSKLRHTLRRLVGPFPVGVIELCTLAAFAMQLLLSYIFCIACILVRVFSTICQGGSDAIAKAVNLTSLLRSSDKAPGLIEDFNMDSYCSVASDANESAVALLVGTVIVVLGQAGLMACMSEYVGRVCQAAEVSSREPFAVRDSKPEAKPKAELPEAGATSAASDGQGSED